MPSMPQTLLHYKDKLHTYEESKGGSPFMPDVKIMMFQNGVSMLPELAAVQHMDELLHAHTPAGSTGKVKGRSVYTHDMYPDNDDDDEPRTMIDFPIDSLHVFQTDSMPSSWLQPSWPSSSIKTLAFLGLETTYTQAASLMGPTSQ